MCVMTILQAKEIDTLEYLSSIGHRRLKVSGQNYWYRSPLHDEKVPSFKINRNMNRWYDFSEGRGGNLVDFGIMYHRCSINNFLQLIDTPVNGMKLKQPVTTRKKSDIEEGKKTEIIDVKELSSFPL